MENTTILMCVYEQEWYKEYHKGYMTRMNDKPFDYSMNDDWKQGWESANRELKYSAMSLFC